MTSRAWGLVAPRALLLAALLVPSNALSQPRAQRPSPPWEGALPHGVEGRSASDVTSRVGRITFEVLAGLGGGAVALAAGVGLACGVIHGRCEGDPLLYGGALGAAFGVPGAVTLTGNLFHGNGSYAWSLLGEVALTLSGAILAYALDDGVVTGVVAVVAPVLGSVLGYEISSGFGGPRAPARASPSFSPSVVLGRAGPSLGLGVAF